MVVNLSSASLVVGGGKDGQLYVLNGGNLGGSGDSNAAQHFFVGAGIYSTAAFWNNTLYSAPNGLAPAGLCVQHFHQPFQHRCDIAIAYRLRGSGARRPPFRPVGHRATRIVWVIDGKNYCLAGSAGCGPAVLRAYDATSLSSELWNSSLASADNAGNAVKFTVPTVANGKVYVGTRGNNIGGAFGSTSISGELDVYGLKPN